MLSWLYWSLTKKCLGYLENFVEIFGLLYPTQLTWNKRNVLFKQIYLDEKLLSKFKNNRANETEKLFHTPLIATWWVVSDYIQMITDITKKSSVLLYNFFLRVEFWEQQFKTCYKVSRINQMSKTDNLQNIGLINKFAAFWVNSKI